MKKESSYVAFILFIIHIYYYAQEGRSNKSTNGNAQVMSTTKVSLSYVPKTLQVWHTVEWSYTTAVHNNFSNKITVKWFQQTLPVNILNLSQPNWRSPRDLV